MAALSHTAAQIAVGPTFRVSVDRVQISAVVTNAKGQHVTDLGIADFTVLDDGEPQQLTSCEYIRLVGVGREPAVARPPQGRPTPSRAAFGELTPEQVRRTIVFLVDDESFAPTAVPVVRQAIKSLIEQRLEPGDLAALIRTSSGSGSLEQFTTDRRVLLESCERVRWRPESRGNPGLLPQTSGFVFGEEMGSYLVADSINRTTAVLKYVISALRELPGRKAIIFLSQSLPSGPKYSVGGRLSAATDLGALVDSALRAGVVIYGIDPTPLSSLTPGADYDVTRDALAQAAGQSPFRLDPGMTISSRGAAAQPLVIANRARDLLEYFRGGLRVLADGTGGMMAADTDVVTALGRFADDLQGYYLLVYKPKAPERYFAASGSQGPPFRSIKVRVARSGTHIRTYAGYIAQAEAAPPESSRDAIAKALFSPFSASGIGLNLTPVFTVPKPASPELNVLMHIDVGGLAFTPGEGGRHNAAFKVIARVAGERNEPAQMVTKEAVLGLTENSFQEATSVGMTYRFSVPAPRPGMYEIRVAIQDAASGKLGTAREYVEVPDLKNGRPAVSGVLAYSATQRAPDSNAPGLAELRTFRRQDTLAWACQLFNAESFKAEAWILQDGKKVTIAPGQVSENGDGTATATGLVPLAVLEPGSYILKIVARPPQGNEIAASQWTDFEVFE